MSGRWVAQPLCPKAGEDFEKQLSILQSSPAARCEIVFQVEVEEEDRKTLGVDKINGLYIGCSFLGICVREKRRQHCIEWDDIICLIPIKNTQPVPV